jgi:lipid-A-disaccharide synthase
MKAFLLAGEVSGDLLGAALMSGLRELRPDITFDGVGGAHMTAQGLCSRFDMSELSVMGLAEILPKYRHLKRRIREVAEAILDTRPDVVVTIDAPDFSFRVARLVKARAPGIRIVHYVAPTVWAWRAGRAKKLAGLVDQVLALFPFEPPYFEREGLRCDFVGHPVVELARPSDDLIQAMGAAGPHLCLLPGSRVGEVKRLLPIFGDVVTRMQAALPDLHVTLPAAAPVAGLVCEMVKDWRNTTVLDARNVEKEQAEARKLAAFAACDLAIAASGTVSLELAAMDAPMVIAYDMSWISRRIIQRMLLVDTVTLVNLVSDTRAVPEYIGDACQADDIAAEALRLLGDPDQRAAQHAAMRLTMERLGRGGEAPGLRAARAVLDGLG